MKTSLVPLRVKEEGNVIMETGHMTLGFIENMIGALSAL